MLLCAVVVVVVVIVVTIVINVINVVAAVAAVSCPLCLWLRFVTIVSACYHNVLDVRCVLLVC